MQRKVNPQVATLTWSCINLNSNSKVKIKTNHKQPALKSRKFEYFEFVFYFLIRIHFMIQFHSWFESIHAFTIKILFSSQFSSHLSLLLRCLLKCFIENILMIVLHLAVLLVTVQLWEFIIFVRLWEFFIFAYKNHSLILLPLICWDLMHSSVLDFCGSIAHACTILCCNILLLIGFEIANRAFILAC